MLVRHALVTALACTLVACGGSPSTPATPADQSPGLSPASEANDDPGAATATPGGTASGDPGQPTKAAEPPPDPYADMPHPPDTDSGRFQLAADDVRTVVNAYRPHLRELCWTPRVNRGEKGPDTVRVAMQVEVSKEGQVRTVQASGGQPYEGLAGCVEEHAKRWHFPKAKQVSTLMFPVVFNRGESKLIRVE
jgi:hypothetical protein